MLPLLYLKEDEILWIKIYQKDISLIKMLPNTCTDYGIFLRWTYINFLEQKNLCYILFIALWCVHKKNLHLQISSCRKSLPICVQNKNIWFFKNWIWIYKLRNMCNYMYYMYMYMICIIRKTKWDESEVYDIFVTNGLHVSYSSKGFRWKSPLPCQYTLLMHFLLPSVVLQVLASGTGWTSRYIAHRTGVP